jgi:lysophospholipase L1-like esterase
MGSRSPAKGTVLYPATHILLLFHRRIFLVQPTACVIFNRAIALPAAVMQNKQQAIDNAAAMDTAGSKITCMKPVLFLFVLAQTCIAGLAQNRLWRYDFGEGPATAGYTRVTPQTVYTPQTGFGLENPAAVKAGGTGRKTGPGSDYLTAATPFYFSVKLPEGNYHVKVLLGDARDSSCTTIKAECRRLMVEKIVTRAGQQAIATFTVHVRDSLIHGAVPGKVRLKPREHNYFHWDDKLTLEFSNTAPKVCAVEITPVTGIPAVFLAGNSTVVDQAEEPWAAWGQMFPVFLQPGKVCVANYAESGETLRAFERENRLQKIWSLARAGDYLFIEFAHNDQKPGGNHLDAFTGYKQTLKNWITEARKRGITPVLVTSMHRRSFDSTGKIANTLEGYPEAMRQTGKEENVTVLDLNAMSKILYEAWGPEASVKAFVHYPANTFPQQPKPLRDDTHFNAYGAYELAKCITAALQQTSLPLKRYIVPGFKGFNPAHPDPVASFHLPASTYTATVKPDGS